MRMATADDVAAAIVERSGQMTAMKLQKLVYYSQAWHLVWEDRPLFPERIEAWANGPVVPSLYQRHRGVFRVRTWKHGSSTNLTREESETIGIVLDAYGPMTAGALSELTHNEPPWVDARKGLLPGERGNREISRSAMAEYYASLL